MSKRFSSKDALKDGLGPPKPEKKKRATARRSRKKVEDDGVLRSSDYEKYMKGKDLEAAVDYDMSGAYELDGLIKHAKFGIGVITEVKPPKKMAVLFDDGPRTLIMNR